MIKTDPLAGLITDDSKAKDDKKDQSFLHETQKEGKASGKMALKDLDDALGEVTHIINEEAVTFYKNTPEEEWPTTTMAVYSHDIREIVPAGTGKTKRGRDRIVCGKTGSRKVSLGREEVLRRYYHVDDSKKDDKPRPANNRKPRESRPKGSQRSGRKPFQKRDRK